MKVINTDDLYRPPFECPGLEIEPTVFSGCDLSGRNDCPVCLGTGYIINCPVCGDPVKSNSTCKNGCWYPLKDIGESPESEAGRGE